jgi:hypothetical protein
MPTFRGNMLGVSFNLNIEASNYQITLGHIQPGLAVPERSVMIRRLKKTPWPESAIELYRPSDRRLSAKLVPTFADRGVPRGRGDGSLQPYARL